MGYKKERQGEPGSVLASAAMVDKALGRTGHAVHQMQATLELMEDHDMGLKAIRLSTRAGAAGEWLAVITMDGPDGSVVGFHSAESLPSVLEGLRNKLVNGSIKWRPDEYAK